MNQNALLLFIIKLAAISIKKAKFQCCVYVYIHISLDDHVKELIPIGRLEPAKTHRQSLDFLYNIIFNLILLLVFLLARRKLHLQQTLFY